MRPGERGPRDRRPFTITETGRAAFAEWVRSEPGLESIRFPLLLTISFGRHLPPAVLADFVAHHREVHVRRLAGYERRRSGASEVDVGDKASQDSSGELDHYSMATLDFGIRYERAVLEWFDELTPEIPGPEG